MRPHTAALLDNGRRPECVSVEEEGQMLGLVLLALLCLGILGGGYELVRFILGR